MMKIISEFKQFAMRGNVVDLAVGVIIGGAFGKIITSLVEDILMPPIGLILGGVNFSDLKIILKAGVGDIAPITLNYGSFLQATVDFLIIAVAIFMLIKSINALAKKKEEPVKPAEIPNQEKLLTEIRDLLKNK
ncbi:MAG: large-conductance mechanosensitive channel [Candidatus Moranbacteria bacterium RBG_19FT_COMBO_42_6]|nr:MAG: large-conductance mechanosensitive channel [Candidatus Moranbacteria bacterium RBG_19FT_COMBO_42_6]